MIPSASGEPIPMHRIQENKLISYILHQANTSDVWKIFIMDQTFSWLVYPIYLQKRISEFSKKESYPSLYWVKNHQTKEWKEKQQKRSSRRFNLSTDSGNIWTNGSLRKVSSEVKSTAAAALVSDRGRIQGKIDGAQTIKRAESFAIIQVIQEAKQVNNVWLTP